MENKNSVVLIRNGIVDKTNIYSGDCELIDSRVVIAFDSNSPFEIEEIFNNKFKIIIRIIFNKDKTGKLGLKFKADQLTNTIEYECINFDNTLGSGTKKPLEIGTFDGKRMYIHFWVYVMGESEMISRKLEYSIWKER